jgi:hypothetical protein
MTSITLVIAMIAPKARTAAEPIQASANIKRMSERRITGG